MLVLDEATRRTGHELLIEIIASRGGAPVDATTMPRALERIYGLGVRPDWWKLPAPAEQAEWDGIAAAIARHDPHCRGVLLLGLDAPEATLFDGFALAARQSICKGFAVGRTIFGDPAEAWFAGRIDDATAVERMAATYRRLIERYDASMGL